MTPDRSTLLELPSVGEIAHYLREGYADFCVQMPEGRRVVPEEIWIPALSCWLRADGSLASFDIQRGFERMGFSWFQRWRLRRAIARFRQLHDRFDEKFGHLRANQPEDKSQ